MSRFLQHPAVMEDVTKNHESLSVYRPLPFFMLRTPLLPAEWYGHLFSASDDASEAQYAAAIAKLETLSRHPVVREAIAVASPTLFEALHSLAHTGESRKRDQTVRSFMRYVIRMITRPTPFGLCSGVACGKWGEESRGRIALHSFTDHKKRTRPDMEWLMELIRTLESMPDVVEQLQVRTNSIVYLTGSRAKLSYLINTGPQEGGGRKKSLSSSIQASPVVQMVLHEAKEMIPYLDLRKKVEADHPETPPEKIRHFLWQLFRQEYLISELRPPLSHPSPFAYVLERLQPVQGIDELKKELKDIATLIADYDQLRLGEGTERYRGLSSKMRSIIQTDHPLQVDLQLSAEQVELPAEVAQEAARAAQALCRLSANADRSSFLQELHTDFIERYGIHGEVPLLLLLDEDLGLGSLEEYELRAENKSARGKTTKRSSLLLELLLSAQMEGKQEVELTDEHLEAMAPGGWDEGKAPKSLELYATLSAKNRDELGRGDFRLIVGANPGSNGAGKTFGRFADLFGESFLEQLREVHAAEQALDPDAVHAEISYLPAHDRLSNVTLSPNIRPYEIVLGTNPGEQAEEKALPLSDLFVGATLDSLYIRSASLGKEIIPTTGHMLTLRNTPPVYRFLREIAQERQGNWGSFSWGGLEQSPHVPRIRYGKSILSLARWRIYKHTAPFSERMSKEAWMDAVKEWREKWKLPQQVFLTEGDNRILLDLMHPLHVEMLHREFEQMKPSESLVLTETPILDGEHLAQTPDGPVWLEVAIPLVKRGQRQPVTEKLPSTVASRILEGPARYHLPGGQWLYAKLYGCKSREEECIGFPMRQFCAEMERKGLADACFFMRYKDPETHVRLRFRGEPSRLTSELLPELHAWARGLQQAGMLTRLVIDTYEPEIERYGGPALIALAEDVFAADSRAVSGMLALKRGGNLGIAFSLLGVISVLDIAEQFGMSFEQQLDWFERRYEKKAYQQEFREARRLYLTLGNADGEWAGLASHPDGRQLLPLLQQRKPALSRFAAKIREAYKNDELHNTPDNILASVIHMNVNRLFGTDRESERKVMALARHTLYGLRHARANRV
ncbi:lantibiotic dehydratase [Brevibacillus ruminantium]|uniref:Lantibiotic dehydratase n=1 Tax=Brevibacillus ruminantium TaxID=2950604 RepID=A0ABY4WAD7_9BACL|nr:lantibiotic dehydratase [Brevibacillus ruminantium]USG63894.1 lantibiotic dehydratase [Brevibacillus ruminantium]